MLATVWLFKFEKKGLCTALSRSRQVEVLEMSFVAEVGRS